MPRPNLKEVPEHLHEEIILVKEDDLKKAFGGHAGICSDRSHAAPFKTDQGKIFVVLVGCRTSGIREHDQTD